MKNLGLHHVSSLVSDIHTSYPFYHKTMGLKLLMKTVNQDETTMYHLFFSDLEGRPGTEFTVFQLNTFKQNSFGTNAIERTVFAVSSLAALIYWEERLTHFNVEHCGIEPYQDSHIIRFEDPDGLQLGLSVVAPDASYLPNPHSDVPLEYGIVGLHSVHLRVRYPKATSRILEDFFQLEKVSSEKSAFPVTVFKNKDTPFQHEVHLIEDKVNPLEDQGIGGIHHVAFYVESYADLLMIQEKIDEKNMVTSEIVPREFFDATYFRDPNGLLFEVATKTHPIPIAPEMTSIDEVPLYLPTFLESKRQRIESELSKIDESRRG